MGVWKLVNPTQLRQELKAQLEAAFGMRDAAVMRDKELSIALRAEHVYVPQLQHQLNFVSAAEEI